MYRGFESLSLRKNPLYLFGIEGFFFLVVIFVVSTSQRYVNN
jgi:hypothetical protein